VILCYDIYQIPQFIVAVSIIMNTVCELRLEQRGGDDVDNYTLAERCDVPILHHCARQPDDQSRLLVSNTPKMRRH
jgi:hypothetical protein